MNSESILGGGAALGSSGGATKRIVIRIPNWIGDAIMAFPAVRALGHRFPEAEWCLLGIPRTLPLFEGLGRPFRLLPTLGTPVSRPVPFFRAVNVLRSESFEAALVLPPSFSSALMARLSGVSLRLGWPSDGRGSLLSERGPDPSRDRHLRLQYWDLAAQLARSVFDEELPHPDPIDSAPIQIPLTASEIAWAESWWRERAALRGMTIALAPGASYGPTKRWPVERFAELGRRLLKRGLTPLWTGGPEESELCRDLAERAGGLSVAGKLSLRQSLSALVGVRALVTNDSGAMHLGQASGVPVVAVFGSTSPTWTGPVGERAQVIYRSRHCSPCFARTCPTQIECLTEIDVDSVESSLEPRIERLGSRDGNSDTPVWSRSPLGSPAVFLDRDGTVLEFVDYLARVEDVRVREGAPSALRKLREAGYQLVLVTNQSAIARGRLDEARLDRIHRRMEQLLGLRFDQIEYCPHHPDLTGPCDCRKPAPGMIWRAAHSLGIDLERSFLIGDHATDMAAAANAGVRGLRVRTGYGTEGEESADVPYFDDVVSASGWILSEARSRQT